MESSDVYPEEIKEFDRSILTTLKGFVKAVKSADEYAKQFLRKLINQGYVPDNINDEEFKSNIPLMGAILKHIANLLPSEIESNPRYGLGKISEWDLYFHCKTNDDLNAFIAEKKLQISMQEGIEMQKSRSALNKWVGRTRQNLIAAMELVGAPAKVAVAKKTTTDIAAEIQNDLNSAKAVSSSTHEFWSSDELATSTAEAHKKARLMAWKSRVDQTGLSGDQHLDEDEDEDDDIETVAINYLVGRFPSIKGTGVFIYIDYNERLAIANDDFNESISTEFYKQLDDETMQR